MTLTDSFGLIVSGITILAGLFALVKIGYFVSDSEKKIYQELSKTSKTIEDNLDLIIRRLDSIENAQKHRNEISELRLTSLKEKIELQEKETDKKFREIYGYLAKNTDFVRRDRA